MEHLRQTHFIPQWIILEMKDYLEILSKKKKKKFSLDPTYIPCKATKEKKIPKGKKDPQSGSMLPHEMNTSLFPVELLDFNLTRD